MAKLSNRVVLAAVVAAGGKLGRKEIAEKLNCQDSTVTAAVNGAVKQFEEFLAMDPNSNLDLPGGKKIKVSDYMAHCEKNYGKFIPRQGDEKHGKFEKLIMKDKRGREKLSIVDKLGLGLDDLEI